MIIKKQARLRRAKKFRCLLKLQDKLRLTIHKTSRHIYAQIILHNKCLVSASTLEREINIFVKNTSNQLAAKQVGKFIALRGLKKGIKKVVFDRSGFKYHGRVKGLAESARKYGLLF